MSDETHGIMGAAARKSAGHSAEAQARYEEALAAVRALKCDHPDHMDAVYSAVACFGCQGGVPSANCPHGGD